MWEGQEWEGQRLDHGGQGGEEELGRGRVGYPTLKAKGEVQMREGNGPCGVSRVRAGDTV